MRGAADRLSALPDALLHHIMSSLKAWEVVRTCVLSRRWRLLWASAPCVDLRVSYSGRGDEPPEEFRDFVHRFFLFRDPSAPVDTLRLRSSDEDAGFEEEDANTWVRTAIKRNARVIHLAGHRRGLALLESVPFVSCHLKTLKLSYARLDDRILKQLSSRCTSLEELDLKDCLVTGDGIVSASLRTLIMLKCKINWAFSIAAPNLLLLRLITPYVRVPSFKNLKSLVTGTIILDDSFLGDDYEHISDEDDCDGTTDDDGDDSDSNDKRENYKVDDDSFLSDDDFGYFNDDGDDLDENTDEEDGYDKSLNYILGYGHGYPKKRYGHGGYKDNYGYGSDIDSDDNTYECSEIANDAKYGYHGDSHNSSKGGNYGESSGCNDSKILGGHHILHSLSSARSLELLTDAGEHSPNIEKLFLQLKLNFNTRKTLGTGIKLQGRSSTCKDLRMVKIKCSKDDARVHKLAHLLRANGIPLEKIYVLRFGNAYLRGQKLMRDLAKHELEFWGM